MQRSPLDFYERTNPFEPFEGVTATMNHLHRAFLNECEERVASYPHSPLATAAAQFMAASVLPKYSYNFAWLGRPIIQYPQDIVAVQELIWKVKPDLIIETGIAHGGSLLFSASMLALLDMIDAQENGTLLDPNAPKRKVLGIDIDIREHNKKAIEEHPMANRVEMIQDSSIAPECIKKAHEFSKGFKKIMVFLDSNHTHEHVLAELQAYAPLTSVQSYCIVFDTIIEDLPTDMYLDRSWSLGNNPKTAIAKYLETHSEFQVDQAISNKLLISVAPSGYLRRIKS